MIDWYQLIWNLLAVMKSPAKIQHATNEQINHMTIKRLRDGIVKEPKFSKGLILLDLHLDVCGIEKHRKLMS